MNVKIQWITSGEFLQLPDSSATSLLECYPYPEDRLTFGVTCLQKIDDISGMVYLPLCYDVGMTSEDFLVSVRNVLDKVREAGLRDTCIVPMAHVDLFDESSAGVLVDALTSCLQQDKDVWFDEIRICETSIWPDLSESFDLD